MIFQKIVYLLFLSLCFSLGQSDVKIFNLDDYGAVEGGKVDSSQALLKAWNDSCKWNGESKLQVNKGTYLVNPVILSGPCVGPIEFLNSGTLRAPPALRGVYWIDIRYVDRLTLSGGGVFDGQGPPTKAEPNLPTLMYLSFVTNSTVNNNIKLINSQSTHLHLFSSNEITINQISISSPGDSPNTDGIKISRSSNITISNTNIASGDDCVAIIRGSKKINVTGVVCGPGHGISIGSLGSSPNEEVEDVTVQNCQIFDTTNGLRIKSWAKENIGLVNNIIYQDISLKNVSNPIIIDQNYCPPRTCPEGNSKVQIKNVKLQNIYGTSKTITAVNLQCSGSNPCENIVLHDINISYVNGGQNTVSNCSNVRGQVFGVQNPKSCI